MFFVPFLHFSLSEGLGTTLVLYICLSLVYLAVFEVRLLESGANIKMVRTNKEFVGVLVARASPSSLVGLGK